ncbi:MAG: aryl-sulfate sulfotransferase [Chloroflexi bacterium]|nr:aryl-sulfate sulfotransferase [Chloroflexota bacterium]
MKNTVVALFVAASALFSLAQSPAETTPSVPRGTVDPDLLVDVYDAAKAWPGTTLLPDNHDLSRPRIIEVNMAGEIIWQYVIPSTLRQYTNPGFDVEPLLNNNVLFVLPRNGIYEIDRTGKVVWSHLDAKVSHDADRLPNGNTLYVYGAYDERDDAQVKEVNQKGETVWAWYARDHFNRPPFTDIYVEGWTHTNAVSRLANGNTLISLRNFDFVAEVDPSGTVVRTIGEGIFREQHDPVMLPNGNVLAADHATDPNRAVEIDPAFNRIVWQFATAAGRPVRDANRLPNGNTLITGSSGIVEVTPEKEVVWRLRLKTPLVGPEGATKGFYKAERISSPDAPAPTATPSPVPTPTGTATPAAATPAPSSNQIQLSAGWNLISVPGPQTDSSVSAVFAGAPGVTRVQTFQDGAWLFAGRTADGWGGALAQIIDGKAYWVSASEAATLSLRPKAADPLAPRPSYPLPQGMSMIGFTSSQATMPVDTYLSSLSGKWSTLYRYNPVLGWEMAKPGGLGFTGVELGRGYWIQLTESGTLAP